MLHGLTDKRSPRGMRWSLADVLLQIFLALCVCRTSLASMEVMSGRLSAAVRRIFDLPDGQISDTTFGRTLALVRWQELGEQLWSQV